MVNGQIPCAREALEKLKGSGVKRVVILTGDKLKTAFIVGAALAAMHFAFAAKAAPCIIALH